MKSISLMAITALTLSGAALAQTQDYSSSSSSTQTEATSPASSQSAPAPAGAATPTDTTPSSSAVIETHIDLTSEPGPPADLHAARVEAVNALAWAKREGCRSDPSPRECVSRAQDEYRATMARLGGSGSVSASGTSQAGSSDARAPRTDRN